MSPQAIDPEKARKKEIHRKSMVLTGATTVACALAGAYLAFVPGVRMPDWMLGSSARDALEPPPKLGLKTLVRWREWSPELLKRAQKDDRLILLDLRAPWSRQARQMDQAIYADPELARFVEERFLPVSVDAELRPDLALRYLSGGWPSTALLLPTGEILSAGTVMKPASFKRWAAALDDGFRNRRAAVTEAVARAGRERKRVAARDAGPSAAKALDAARAALEGELSRPPDWGARFPRLGWAALLAGVSSPGWPKILAREAAKQALPLEDPVWSGIYRYCAGPGWRNPEHEKRLDDQIDAYEAFSRLNPGAAARVLGYVDDFLSDARGGYYSSQGSELARPDGRVLEGRHYFALSDGKRRALGIPWVDQRLFADENGRMAAAVLSSEDSPLKARQHALKTLERWWRQGVRRGLARRELAGGPVGLLQDQIGLSAGFLAAYEATSRRQHLERALALVRGAEAELLDARTNAFFDRRPAGELAVDLDRLLVTTLNARMRRLLLELAESAGPAHPDHAWLSARAAALRPWLYNQAAALDPAELTVLASRAD